MRMKKILFYLSGALLTIMSCSTAQTKKSVSNINQGIEGYIYLVSGNQMPSPDRRPSPPKGIKSTLYIYPLTNINQVTQRQQSPFYSAIKTKIIKKTESDSTGFFKVQLEPGKYSVFTKKGALFYANIFDNYNNIAPVEVFAGKLTKVEIKIDFNATY